MTEEVVRQRMLERAVRFTRASDGEEVGMLGKEGEREINKVAPVATLQAGEYVGILIEGARREGWGGFGLAVGVDNAKCLGVIDRDGGKLKP